MIKLKLTNEQLQILCSFTKPGFFESEAKEFISISEFFLASYSFNLMAIGERAAKLYLFGHKKKHAVSLTISEACSLLEHIRPFSAKPDTFGGHVALIIKNDLHRALTNYQKRFI